MVSRQNGSARGVLKTSLAEKFLFTSTCPLKEPRGGGGSSDQGQEAPTAPPTLTFGQGLPKHLCLLQELVSQDSLYYFLGTDPGSEETNPACPTCVCVFMRLCTCVPERVTVKDVGGAQIFWLVPLQPHGHRWV